MSQKNETFEEYIKSARNEFCESINRQEWDTELRCASESFLIAYDQVVDGFQKLKKGITELESKLRWIPVSERLPDQDGIYEVLYCGKHYKMLYYSIEFGWANVSDSEKITHHRKVPEL